MEEGYEDEDGDEAGPNRTEERREKALQGKAARAQQRISKRVRIKTAHHGSRLYSELALSTREMCHRHQGVKMTPWSMGAFCGISFKKIQSSQSVLTLPVSLCCHLWVPESVCHQSFATSGNPDLAFK